MEVEVAETVRPWRVIGRRTVYASGWMDMQLVDVQLPDGSVINGIHMVDYKFAAAGVVALTTDGRVLLVDHYRFQTDTRSWEVPAGKVDAGEMPEEAIGRELREETGYQGESFLYLGHYYPSNGSSNQVFHLFLARNVRRLGEIEDTNEVQGLRAFKLAEVRGMIARNEILDGMSLTALCWAIARGEVS